MAELFSNISAFSVFLSIATVGFLFLLTSLIFGEMFEHFGDGAMDHDLSSGGPSFFSVRVLSVFVTAFGGFGAVGTHYGLSIAGSSGLGFAAGLVFALLIYLFASFLYRQQASTELLQGDLIGQNARVVIPIPTDGVGQVRCRVGEEMIDKVARSKDGASIPENSVVRIEQSLGEMLIVQRM